jgi:hypothetical protein
VSAMNAGAPRSRGTLVAAIALALLCVALGDRLRAKITSHLWHVKETSEVYALPPPETVHRLALGYDDAVASILWASVLYQYGDHVGHNTRFVYAGHYLRTILTLDPKFRAAYKFGSTLVTMQIQEPDRAQIDELRALLFEGTKVMPDDPDVWGAYATFMLFEGAQYLDPEEKKAWRIEGAAAAQRAVELGYFMDTLGVSGAIYLEQAGYKDLAIAQLERAYAVAPNEETRQRILVRLQRLQAQSTIDRLRRGMSEFLDRWSHEAPFFDEATFVLTGPKRDPFACVGLVGVDATCDPSVPIPGALAP